MGEAHIQVWAVTGRSFGYANIKLYAEPNRNIRGQSLIVGGLEDLNKT